MTDLRGAETPRTTRTESRLNGALLSIRQAARLMGTSERLARRLAHTGQLPGFVKFEGSYGLVRKAVLERWLDGLDG